MTTTKKTPAKAKAAAKKAAAQTSAETEPIKQPETQETTAPAEPQLDWDNGAQQLAEPEQRARKLTKREIDALPKVEESVLAQNLKPNCTCPLTPGCNGRIITYSTHQSTKKDAEGNPVARNTDQYLKCSKCNRVPLNPRRVSTALVDTKLFDRRRTKRSD